MIKGIEGAKQKFERDGLIIWDLYSGNVSKNNRLAFCHDDSMTAESAWNILEEELLCTSLSVVTIRTRTSPSASSGNTYKVKLNESETGSSQRVQRSSGGFGGNMKEMFLFMQAMNDKSVAQQQQMTNLLIQQMQTNSQTQIAMLQEQNKAALLALEHKFEIQQYEDALEAAQAPENHPMIGAVERLANIAMPFFMNGQIMPSNAPSVGIAGLEDGEVVADDTEIPTDKSTESEPTENTEEKPKLKYNFEAKDICKTFGGLQKLYPQYNMLDVWNKILEKASNPATKAQIDMGLKMLMS